MIPEEKQNFQKLQRIIAWRRQVGMPDAVRNDLTEFYVKFPENFLEKPYLTSWISCKISL